MTNIAQTNSGHSKPRSFRVTCTLTCGFGFGAGYRFAPEVIGTYNKRWKARLAQWWAEFNDERHPREYRIEEINDRQGCSREDARDGDEVPSPR